MRTFDEVCDLEQLCGYPRRQLEALLHERERALTTGDVPELESVIWERVGVDPVVRQVALQGCRSLGCAESARLTFRQQTPSELLEHRISSAPRLMTPGNFLRVLVQDYLVGDVVVGHRDRMVVLANVRYAVELELDCAQVVERSFFRRRNAEILRHGGRLEFERAHRRLRVARGQGQYLAASEQMTDSQQRCVDRRRHSDASSFHAPRSTIGGPALGRWTRSCARSNRGRSALAHNVRASRTSFHQ